MVPPRVVDGELYAHRLDAEFAFSYQWPRTTSPIDSERPLWPGHVSIAFGQYNLDPTAPALVRRRVRAGARPRRRLRLVLHRDPRPGEGLDGPACAAAWTDAARPAAP
jgi:hypothetical protein